MVKRTLVPVVAALGMLAFAASAQAAYLTLGTTNTSNAPTTLTGNTAGPELKVVNANASNQALTAVAGGGSGIAVYGTHNTAAGTGPAIRGDSASTAAGAFSLYGLLSATAPAGANAAVRGENKATNAKGYGVWGSQGGGGTGVYGSAPSGIGVFGSTTSGAGVRGNTTSGKGVFGNASTGTGVYGAHTAATGTNAGVSGQTSSSGFEAAGVSGTAASATGVLGTSAANIRAGVVGRNSGVGGHGVVGCANYGSNYELYCNRGGNAGGTGGVFIGAAAVGYPNGVGVEAVGRGTKGVGIYAQGDLYGVSGSSSSGNALDGRSSSGNGVYGYSAGNDGVVGVSASSTHAGVAGSNSNGGNGIYGERVGDVGYAGYFVGPVGVTGTLSKGGGSFKIDHPLDPAHKYLQHSFVESPDMMNVYNGNIRTDRRGFATARLPRWFRALNRDFRYQLTVVGRSFARAIVWREIHENRFTLRTDQPRVKVSWQVTGIRHDRFANANRIQVVVPKAKKDQGKYLYPELYGKPRSQAIGYRKPLKPRGKVVEYRR